MEETMNVADAQAEEYTSPTMTGADAQPEARPSPTMTDADAQPEARPSPLTPADRRAAGKRLRDLVPRDAHADWRAHAGRADPIGILHAADANRQPDLVPLRYGRMLQSPFTFYRGSAGVMAADLAETPATGLHVQVCGDAHLMNFGGFATPERRLIFDINDLDETLPAPWEWDVKRLVASFVLAARSNGLSDADGRDAAVACARSYRRKMRDFAAMDVLDVWYARLDDSDFLAMLPEKRRAMAKKRIAKATAASSSELVFPKLVEQAGGQPHIRDTPPTIFHAEASRAAGDMEMCRGHWRSTGRLWPRTGASCSTAITWWMRRSRSSASAASAPCARWR
jgi:hypothetical protein